MYLKYDSLDEVYKVFSENPSQEAYENVLLNVLLLSREEETVYIPTEMTENNEMTYGLVETTDGYYYIVCTGKEELDKCPQINSTEIYLEYILMQAIGDSEVRGIAVNPYSNKPCYIPGEYLKTMIEKIKE